MTGLLTSGIEYDVKADRQRFLINEMVETKEAAPLTVVVNWTAEAKR